MQHRVDEMPCPVTKKRVGNGLPRVCDIRMTGAPQRPLDVLEILARATHPMRSASAMAGGVQMVISSLAREGAREDAREDDRDRAFRTVASVS